MLPNKTHHPSMRFIYYPEGHPKHGKPVKSIVPMGLDVWYKSPKGRPFPIDMTEYDGVTRHEKAMKVRPCNNVTIGHWTNPEKYLALRPNATAGEEQLEFTIKHIKFNGEEQTIDVSKNDPVEHEELGGVLVDKGSVVIEAGRIFTRQYFKVPEDFEGTFDIKERVHIKGLVRKDIMDLPTFYSQKTDRRFILAPPKFFDEDFEEIPIEDLAEGTTIEGEYINGNYIKRGYVTDPRVRYIDVDTYYGNTSDGRIAYANVGDWGTCQGASAGNNLDLVSWSNTYGFGARELSGNYSIYRLLIDFDTSAVGTPADASCFVYGKTNIGGVAAIQQGTQNIAMTVDDYDSFVGGAIDTIDPWTLVYNEFTSIEGLIAAGGVTKVCIREDVHDVSNYAPGTGESFINGNYYADNTGTSKDPYVEVTESSYSITLTDPDGGEDWDNKTKHAIYGTSSGVYGVTTVELDLSLDSGVTFPTELTSALSVSGDGSWTWDWNIDETPYTDFRVRASVTAAPATKDESAANFTISARSFTITWPGGSEEVGVGKTTHKIIITEVGDATHLKVEYYDGSWHTIWASEAIGNLTTPGKTWTIPNAPGVAIKVKVTDASADKSDTPAYDESAEFTIYKLDQTLLEPGGSETLYIGNMFTFEWGNTPVAADGATNVKLWYCTDFTGSKTWQTLSASETNDGSASIEVPDDASNDCGFKVTELDGELLSVTIAAKFTIANLVIVGRKRGVKALLTIEGNDVPVRDFKVHTATEGNIIVRDIEVILPRRSFLASTALLGLHAYFYHGVFHKNERRNFRGQVVGAEIESDEVVLTLVDCTRYLGGERIAIDENVSGWTLGGLTDELLHRTGQFDLTTFQSDLTPDISRMPSDLEGTLPGLSGFDAVNEMMEAAVLIKSMTDVTEYFLLNPYDNVGRIKGVPELDAINLHLPSHESVDLDPGVNAGIPLTRVVMQSKTDSTIEASFTNTALEQLHGPSPVVVKKFPSESPDRLKEAAIHYALLNREPKAAFSLNYHGGYFLRPLMGMDVSAHDLPVDSAYILETEYEGDLNTKVVLDTRRPSLFDLLQ